MTNWRKKVGLLFGCRSAEHAVPKPSAANILRALDQGHYEVIRIRIGRDVRWLLCEGNRKVKANTPSLEVPDGATQIAFVPGGAGNADRFDGASARSSAPLRFDVGFPIPRGPNGIVQGLLELAGALAVDGVLSGKAGVNVAEGVPAPEGNEAQSSIRVTVDPSWAPMPKLPQAV